MAGTQAALAECLRELQAMTPEIEAAAVVSVEGLVIASCLPDAAADAAQPAQEEGIAAMSAAMLGLGERIAAELGRGMVEQMYIKGDKGYIILMRLTDEAALTALAGADATLGLIFLDMRRSAAALKRVLEAH